MTYRLKPARNRQYRTDFSNQIWQPRVSVRQPQRLRGDYSSEETTIVPSISTKDRTQIYRKDWAEGQPVMHNDHVNGDLLDVIVRP